MSVESPKSSRASRVPERAPGSARTLLSLLALLVLSVPPLLHADDQQDRRLEPGLKIFRALLSADLDLERKAVDDRKLLVVFFYTDDRRRAESLAKAFASNAGADGIHGLRVVVETTADVRFTSYESRLPAGVFLTQAPEAAALHAIVQFGVTNHLIVDSPFEGHVESGVLAGLSIEAQVRPYLNETTLNASRISLKPFFLAVAKVFR